MIRVTVHSTALKFGRMPDSQKPEVTSYLKGSDIAFSVVSKQIGVVGFDLSYAQDRALHAVQLLLDETGYKGNAVAVDPQKSARYYFDRTLPVLEIKTADFLRAYGVKQTKTYRSIEFSPQGRRVAMNALKDLALNEHLIVYEKSRAVKSGSKRKTVKDRVEDVAPLISYEKLNGGRVLKIVPNPVLVDQIDSYFMQIPRNLFDLVSGKDGSAIRFLDYLLLQHEHKRRSRRRKKNELPNSEIRISAEAMAWQMRMYAMLRARKRGAIRQKLIEFYDLAVQVGYLDSYKIDQHGTKGRIVDVLQLKNLVPDGAESPVSVEQNLLPERAEASV